MVLGSPSACTLHQVFTACTIPSYEMAVWLLFGGPDFFEDPEYWAGTRTYPVPRSVAVLGLGLEFLLFVLSFAVAFWAWKWAVLGSLPLQPTNGLGSKHLNREWAQSIDYSYQLQGLLIPFIRGTVFFPAFLNALGAKCNLTAYLNHNESFEFTMEIGDCGELVWTWRKLTHQPHHASHPHQRSSMRGLLPATSSAPACCDLRSHV